MVNFRPHSFNPGKEFRYTLNTRLGGPQSRTGQFKQINQQDATVLQIYYLTFSLLVGGSRDQSPVTGDFFSGASDSSMCPGVDSVSKNEYQDFLRVKMSGA